MEGEGYLEFSLGALPQVLGKAGLDLAGEDLAGLDLAD